MDFRKRAIRVASLSGMLAMSSVIVLNGSAQAAPTAPPRGHEKGHVHVDKGAKGANLDRQCAVRIRPHKYAANEAVTFTFTAKGKKPTATPAISVKLDASTVGDNSPQFAGLTPAVVHLDNVASMVAPHGKYKVDSNGKIHNDLHWHVTIAGSDSFGKKFKKDVKVFNCSTANPTAEPDADPDFQVPDSGDPSGVIGDVSDAPDTDNGDTDVPDLPAGTCQPASVMFGSTMGTSTTIKAGSAIGIVYTGDDDLVRSTVEFKVDGKAVTPAIPDALDNGDYNIWYLTPTTLSAGSHTVSVKVFDVAGQCGQTTFTFNSNSGNSGTT
jgi:hypothetical protein